MSVWNRVGIGFSKPLGMGKKRQKAILSAPNSISWKIACCQQPVQGSKNKLTRSRESYPYRIPFNRFILGAGMVRTN